MDLVADLRAAPQGWPSRRAIDLTEDASILTAIANDIGVEEIFQRQVIAYGQRGRRARRALDQRQLGEHHRGPRRGSAPRPASPSPSSATTGARSPPSALADHVIVSRSQHIPRIQEAQASGYHVLRELIELLGIESWPRPPRRRRSRRVRAEVLGTVQGVGFRPFVYRLAAELGLGGWVLNDERGVVLEVEGAPAAVDDLLARLRSQAPPLAVVESVAASRGADRRARLPDPRVGRAAATGGARLAGHRDLRRMRRRALRSGRPALSLSVHQLHQLRPALHDRHAACPTTARVTIVNRGPQLVQLMNG